MAIINNIMSILPLLLMKSQVLLCYLRGKKQPHLLEFVIVSYLCYQFKISLRTGAVSCLVFKFVD